MSEKNKKPVFYYVEEEISLRDILQKIIKYAHLLKQGIKWVVLSIIIGILGTFCYDFFNSRLYQAELTFMLNNDSGSNGGNILSQVFAGGVSGNYNLEKISELAKSRRIIGNVLFKEIELEGEENLIINHFLRIYGYYKKWKGNPKRENFKFLENPDTSREAKESNLYKKIYNQVVGKSAKAPLLEINIRSDIEIFELKYITLNEELSYHMTKTTFNVLEEFYVSKTIEKQQKTYDLVSAKVDSLEQALNRAERNLLRFEDSNRGLFLKQSQSEQQKLQREVNKLMSAYVEVYRNKEAAEFALLNKKPFLQVIDEPLLPLLPRLMPTEKKIFYGLFLGLFFSISFLFIRNIIQENL